MEPLKLTCTTKVKANSVKQEYEKQDELKRSVCDFVIHLQIKTFLAVDPYLDYKHASSLLVLFARLNAKLPLMEDFVIPIVVDSTHPPPGLP